MHDHKYQPHTTPTVLVQIKLSMYMLHYQLIRLTHWLHVLILHCHHHAHKCTYSLYMFMPFTEGLQKVVKQNK
jgi:hypothetical protein